MLMIFVKRQIYANSFKYINSVDWNLSQNSPGNKVFCESFGLKDNFSRLLIINMLKYRELT